MMTIKTGSSAWYAETGIRLDASYHLSEARQAKILIDKAPLGSLTLRQATESVFLGGRFTRVHVTDPTKGYPYLTASDMIKSDPFSGVYLSKAYTKNLGKLTIKKNWILLSCSGSIGRTVYTNDLFNGKVGTHDLIRIVPNPTVLPGGYLYAYLSSKFGYSLLTQGTYGGVIQHIEPHHIADLPIPILPDVEQQTIHKAIETAARLRVEDNTLLAYAIQTLEKRLPELKMPISYVAKSDSFWSERLRLDATAHLTLIDQFLEEAGQNAPLVTIESASERVFTPGIFKRMRVSDPNKGIPFLSGINLLEVAPKFDSFLSRKMPSIDDYILREGWLALQDSGSLSSMGYVSIVPKFLDGASATNNLIRVMPGEVNYNPYFYAFLKTTQGQQILKSFAYGTGQLHIDNGQIARLRIPVYQDLFDTISANVQAYSVKFNEAYELETGAISRVEKLVESW
jgi:hypothetical protein